MFLQVDKRKRLIWCKEQQRSKEDFADVIFTDECTVQLEQHNRVCFRKRLQPRTLKQRAKHPIKVHIWFCQRSHKACYVYRHIECPSSWHIVYEAGLLPFIQERFPHGHRLYQDNDPHSSKYILNYWISISLNWCGVTQGVSEKSL